MWGRALSRFSSRLALARPGANFTGAHIRRPVRSSLRRCFSQKSGRDMDMRINAGPISWAGLTAAMLAGAGVALYYRSIKEEQQNMVSKKVKTFGEMSLGGNWTLVDQHGKPTSNADLLGTYSLIYFGFTRCPDICPNELVKIGEIVERLASKGIEIQPVFISVDPARDYVRQLSEYSKDFHPKILYLTGTPDQIEVAARAYRVYFSIADMKEDDDDDYLLDHSIILYLVNKKQKALDFFSKTVSADEAVARTIEWVEKEMENSQE